MEHSLIAMSNFVHSASNNCLNPYSNGTLSDKVIRPAKLPKVGLNPYSNGTLSDIIDLKANPSAELVLILILMEHSLIVQVRQKPRSQRCLNPYSNGTLSDKENQEIDVDQVSS